MIILCTTEHLLYNFLVRRSVFQSLKFLMFIILYHIFSLLTFFDNWISALLLTMTVCLSIILCTFFYSSHFFINTTKYRGTLKTYMCLGFIWVSYLLLIYLHIQTLYFSRFLTGSCFLKKKKYTKIEYLVSIKIFFFQKV